jgi:hypothetical protein
MAAPKQSTASRSGSDVLIRPLNMVAVILAIQLQRFARSRSTWVFLLGMPLLIVLTLGIALQGAINSEFVPYRPFRLAIAPAGSAAFDAVQSAFETSTDFFDVSTTARDEADARSRVVRREVDVAVIVPEDFPFAPFTVISGPESLAGGIVEAVAHSVLADWIGRELFSDEGPVRLETRQLAAPPAGAGNIDAD